MPRSYMATDPAEKLALARCEIINEHVRNRDSSLEAGAARNLLAGNAAFLVKASYSNAPASIFVARVNSLASIERAQYSLLGFFRDNNCDVMDACWLDYLLPLNSAAVAMLQRAYEDAGTFRSRAELIARTERVELAAGRIEGRAA